MLSQGEWLLLFNYLLPFPEVLQQAAQLPAPTKGVRITANTEMVSATCQSTHGCCSSSPSPGQSYRVLPTSERCRGAAEGRDCTNPVLLLLHVGWGRAQDRPDPAVPAAALCLAGVQVPDPPQHGFQLLLQPRPCPGGESDVPHLQSAALQPFPGLDCHCGAAVGGGGLCGASSTVQPPASPSRTGARVRGSSASRASPSRDRTATSPPSLPLSLQEPFPHLFDQMFARLRLLGAVRDVFHSALATLHLPPLSQI